MPIVGFFWKMSASIKVPRINVITTDYVKRINVIKEKTGNDYKNGITSLAQFTTILNNIFHTPQLPSARKFLYRGESRDYPNHFVPSILRDTAVKINSIEEVNIIKFQQSTEGKKIFENYPSLKDDTNIVWWFLAQHYHYPTRLLDVTHNPYVGLYFACNRNYDDDGWAFVFLTDYSSISLPEGQYGTWNDHLEDERDIYKENQWYLFDPVKFHDKSITFPRLDRQQGCFLFCKNRIEFEAN